MKNQTRRKSKRIESQSGVALTPSGVCLVVNLSKSGLLLKCFVEQGFSDECSVDLYDITGHNVEGLKVKKVWEKKSSNVKISSKFEVEVGGQFENLTRSQETTLQSYLQCLMN